MNEKSLMELDTSSKVVKNAMKNYKTYVEHYKRRNLIPMTFTDFVENYASELNSV